MEHVALGELLSIAGQVNFGAIKVIE